MTRNNAALSYAPVSALIGLFALFYTVFMVAMIPAVLGVPGDNDPPRDRFYPGSDLVGVVVVNVLFVLALISFVRASFTDPGTVPAMYPWDPNCPATYGESTEFERTLAKKGLSNARGLERKMDGRARFCRLCGKYKPDRAHHSSNMGHCVLEMDHYCPWIRNCVGYFNKKYFFLLVVYGGSALLGFVAVMAPHFEHSCDHFITALDFFIIFTWILALLLGSMVSCFAVFHVWLMSHAFTTIEFCEKRRADDTKRNAQGYRLKELYARSPYSISWYHNVSHVLGPWYLWLVPTRAGMPDGSIAGCVFDVDLTHPLYQCTMASGRAGPPHDRPDSTSTSSTAEHDSLLADSPVDAVLAPY